MKLTLPYPPSTWDLYEGWGKTRRLSRSYAKWRDDAGWFIKQPARTIVAPFSLFIALKRPNKRHDLDNRSKAVLDCLQYYQVIKNDNLCERLSMTWDAGLKDECVVIIQECEEATAT